MSTVTIPEEVYDELIRAENKLRALEAAGVDNWEGYGDALCSLTEETEEDIYGPIAERK